MKIRLYLDEDAMAQSLVQALLERGIDVTTANLEGMICRPDPVHLDYATSLGRVLYSFNIGDYCQLHAEYLATNKPTQVSSSPINNGLELESKCVACCVSSAPSPLKKCKIISNS